jgi:hypothetical protein
MPEIATVLRLIYRGQHIRNYVPQLCQLYLLWLPSATRTSRIISISITSPKVIMASKVGVFVALETVSLANFVNGHRAILRSRINLFALVNTCSMEEIEMIFLCLSKEGG